MEILNYAALVVAVLGAVTGLIGETRDKRKSSIFALTSIGWFALVTLSIGFVCSILLTVDAQRRNDLARQQRERVRKIAHDEIESMCQQLSAPFCVMYHDATDSEPWSRNADALRLVVGADAEDTFTSINYSQAPAIDTGFESQNRSYLEWINAIYNSKPDQLLQSMQKWLPYLDSEEIILINDICNHSYLVALQNILPYDDASREEWYDQSDVYYYDFDAYDNFQEHVEFFTKVQRLWQLVRLGDGI